MNQVMQLVILFLRISAARYSREFGIGKDMLEEEQQQRYHLVDAPLVEGAFAAAITAGITDDTQQILTEHKMPERKDGNK